MQTGAVGKMLIYYRCVSDTIICIDLLLNAEKNVTKQRGKIY